MATGCGTAHSRQKARQQAWKRGKIRLLGMHPAWIFLLLTMAGAAKPPGDVEIIKVPVELANITSNPELSGLVWSRELDRYLVVTDDSGLRDKGTNHRPLVLALSRDGVLDKEPVDIRGVATLNDAESICSGPDGTFFLVTSHSPNRKHRTTDSRRQLLWLRLEKRALNVLGKLDLTEVDGGRSLLAIAGLPEDGRLDIEGIAFHDGALFIGLKSPLSARGEASIVRFANPLQAFRSKHIPASALSRFAGLPLCLDVEHKRVCEGISDLFFLPDGSLVLTANAPKGGEKDQGGNVWLLGTPVEKSAPTLLRRFAGLKPEGVTLAPGGASLAIVFDCDQEAPKWIRIPLPPPR